MMATEVKVGLVGTGGSISTIGSDPLDLFQYADHGDKLGPTDLFERYVGHDALPAGLTLHPIDFRAVSSRAIGPAEWLELIEVLRREVPARGLGGVVVAHGSATLEETAYFLHLTSPVDVPVVVTAAMRPPTGLSTDTPINLLTSIRLAGSPAARGMGALVCLNETVHSARDVAKTQAFHVDAFSSPAGGPVGVVDPDPDGVQLHRAPTRPHYPDSTFDLAGVDELPDVPIVLSYSGADGRIIDHVVERGCPALVHAGLGSGAGTKAEEESLRRAVEAGVIVVQASRTGSGRVPVTDRRADAGVLAGDDLNPLRARILTMIAVAKGYDAARLQDLLREV